MEINSRNINILLKVEQTYIPKAEYVLRTFCRIIGLKPRFFYNFSLEDIHVIYSANFLENAPIHIYHNPKSVDFFKEKKPYNKENVNKILFNNSYIPFLFSKQGNVFTISQNKVVIRKDIVSSAFYFLSCWHEYVSLKKNVNTRFSFFESLQYQNDFADIPIVDRYCEIFQRAIVLLMPEFTTNKIWTNQKEFALSISHDIDYWEYWTDKHYEEIVKYNKQRLFSSNFLKALYKLTFHFIDKKLLKNNTVKRMKQIMEKEKKLDIQSTNFILTNTNFENERQNYFKNEKIRDEIKEICKGNIGLHSSPESIKNFELLQKEKSDLNTLGYHFKGNRIHFLYMNYQKTFSLLESVGFAYDATLSYWENYGFRAGISYPYYPFNIEENRPYHFLEIPLTVMDVSLFSKNAMNLSLKESWKRLKLMIDLSVQHQSHISFLWHNTTFDKIDYPGWGNLYWKAIKYAKEKGGWITSLEEIFKFWTSR